MGHPRLFITQPANDTRTPMAPVQAFVDALAARGHHVEMDVIEGGHTGTGTEDSIRMVESWLDFAERVVGG